ncbi:MAG: sugar ABC transporter substrate-binding protein, partial [Angelakisella sp.]
MKRSMIVRGIALVLGSVLALGMVACGNTQPSSTCSAPVAADSTGDLPPASAIKQVEAQTLTVYTWWDIAKFAHLQQMKNDFEAANDDIKIEFVAVPNKYADTMETKLSAGEIPDVMMLGM